MLEHRICTWMDVLYTYAKNVQLRILGQSSQTLVQIHEVYVKLIFTTYQYTYTAVNGKIKMRRFTDDSLQKIPKTNTANHLCHEPQ